MIRHDSPKANLPSLSLEFSIEQTGWIPSDFSLKPTFHAILITQYSEYRTIENILKQSTYVLLIHIHISKPTS